MEIHTLFLYFLIYAFLGWLCESIYISVFRKKIINSGFLNGPVCPIYGIGSIFIVFLLYPFITYPFLIFILGILSTSLLEYFTSWLMEACFNMRWWDYSKHKYNIKGRVCLLNSSLFGIMSLVLIYLVHPLVQSFLIKITTNTQIVLASILLVLFLIDSTVSILSVLNLNRSLQRLHDFLHDIYEDQIEPRSDKFIAENEMIIQNLIKRKDRLIKAFPNINMKTLDIRSIDLREMIEKIKDTLNK